MVCPVMVKLIFFLQEKDDDGKWSKPENLGYPINTIDKDGTMFIAADGMTCLFYK